MAVMLAKTAKVSLSYVRNYGKNRIKVPVLTRAILKVGDIVVHDVILAGRWTDPQQALAEMRRRKDAPPVLRMAG